MNLIKRFASIFIAVLIVANLFSFNVFADSKIAISNFDELCAVSKNLNADYFLTNDIIAPKGNNFKTIGNSSELFTGTFDGKGYKISGINIVANYSASGTSAYAGIFGYLTGTVKNLNLEDVNVSNSGKNWSYVGGIAGVNQGVIENCLVSGKIYNNDVEIAVYSGGICGKLQGGIIKNSVSYANVYSSIGEQYTGGIVGQADKGTVANCAVYGSIFSKGADASMDAYMGGICGRVASEIEITNCLFDGGLIAEKCSNVYMGGICGQLRGKISKSVAIGAVSPSEIVSHTYIGGIVSDSSSKEISECYYLDSIINEEITGKFGTELKAEALSSSSSFSALDFNSIWGIKNGRPVLNNLPQLSPDAPESKLIGIKINSKPKKLTYVQGDSSLDLRGLVVSAVYTDKTVELKQNDYTVSGYNYVSAGKQTISVSYRGFVETFTITVNETDKTIIGPPEITEGSYSDGNANGVVSSKPGKPSNDAQSDKPESQTNDIPVVGENVVEDTLDDDSQDESNGKKNDKESSKNKDKKTKSDKETSSVWVMILNIAIVILALVILVFIALFIFFRTRKKSSTSNEMSNNDISEVEHDPNDIY